jgi:hypothetical protein
MTEFMDTEKTTVPRQAFPDGDERFTTAGPPSLPPAPTEPEPPATSGAGAGGNPPAIPRTDNAGAYYSGEPGAVFDRPWRDVAYWFVLVTAATVDVVNFQGVVALVMRESPDYLTWTVVGGFTVLALALSHRIGSEARARKDRRGRPTRSGTVWLAFFGWFAMGLFAFLVRYRGQVGGGILAQVSGSGQDIVNASLFLTFYVATGLVAGLAGYYRPDPNIRRVRRATKLENRLNDRLSEEDGDLAEVQSMLDATGRSLDRVSDPSAIQDRVDRLLDRIKSRARIRIGSRGVDPASGLPPVSTPTTPTPTTPPTPTPTRGSEPMSDDLYGGGSADPEVAG